jgi:hypothetical protein
MCMGSKTPKSEPPAAAPAPPAEPPVAPVLNETAASDRNLLTAARAGRSSLRIDKATSGPAGGSGLTIPTAS